MAWNQQLRDACACVDSKLVFRRRGGGSWGRSERHKDLGFERPAGTEEQIGGREGRWAWGFAWQAGLGKQTEAPVRRGERLTVGQAERNGLMREQEWETGWEAAAEFGFVAGRVRLVRGNGSRGWR